MIYMRNKRRLRAILFMPLGVVVFAIGWLLCSIPQSRTKKSKMKSRRNNDDTIKFELIAKEEELEINHSVHM